MKGVAVIPEPAQYPALYTAARAALFRCDQLDECAEWSSKAAALASYARQSRDESLRQMAERIQARAVRRAGELLKALPKHTGVHLRSVPTPPTPSRAAAAKAAGLTPKQKSRAISVASIPKDEFEQVVESKNPPTVTQLAERRWSKVSKHNGFALRRIRTFAAFCEVSNPRKLRATISAADEVKKVLAWCTAFLERS
jgi:hypothetical protein